MAAPAPPDAPAAPDPLGARAPKLAALLGLRRGARVLAAGARLRAWEADLDAYFDAEWRASIGIGTIGGGWDLVLWAPTPAETGAGFADALAAIRASLSPGGTLVLMAKNALSLREMAHGAPGLVRSGARTAGGYRARLRAAGFARVHEFAAVPSLDDAEEFVSPPARIALPASGRAERALAAVGLLPLVHDGFVYIAAGNRGGLSSLLQSLREGGEEAGGPATRLERFALRSRGALVLRVRTGAREMVCRVAATGEAAGMVACNAEWTRRLRACRGLEPWARERIPKPSAEIALGDAVLFPERAVDGVVGWMLAPARRTVLWHDLVRFALNLHHATARALRLDEESVERLVPESLPAHAAGLRRAYGEVRAALAARVLGTAQVTAWAHGDYGHGNAIADARSGRLAGVIDWDQGARDAAGTDVLNAAVQRHHLDTGLPYARAFAVVAERFAAGGFAAVDAPAFDAALPLDPAARAGLAAWTALRIVRRSARYAALFAGSEADSAALLGEAAALLARHPAAGDGR
ncbi:MAG TPA: hypothetical protein VLK66_04250 [Longimicrobium sp.]|nr:hypothetical protein [Longimicrobium sp.]